MEVYATGLMAMGKLFDGKPESTSSPQSSPHDFNEMEDLSHFALILKSTEALPDPQNSAGLITIGRLVKKISLKGGFLSDVDRLHLANFTVPPLAQPTIPQTDTRNKMGNTAPSQSSRRAEVEAGLLKVKLEIHHNMEMMVAFDVGFAALEDRGAVLTWLSADGDGRYGNCLGRGVFPIAPLIPNKIAHVSKKCIKIAACGYVAAALTEDKEVFIWGDQGRWSTLAGGATDVKVSHIPHFVNIHDREIVDVAIGEGHIIALSAEHEVYVIGSNKNGQLGIGPDVPRVSRWTKLDLDETLGDSKWVVNVGATRWGSFLVVRGPGELERHLAPVKFEAGLRDWTLVNDPNNEWTKITKPTGS